VEILIEHGANLRAKDCAGNTACLHCFQRPSDELTRSLAIPMVSADSELVNIPNRFGEIGLHVSMLGSPECPHDEDGALWLLRNGANPDFSDNKGVTPLGMMPSGPLSDVMGMSVSKELKSLMQKKSFEVRRARGGGDQSSSSVDNCAMCGAQASSQQLKHCSRCLSVAYCSKKCQQTHWREHKQLCKQKRKNMQPVQPASANGPLGAAPFGAGGGPGYMWSMGDDRGPRPMPTRQDALTSLKPGKRFKVKVQVPIEVGGSSPLYIYNKSRAWTTRMESTDPNYAPLREKIQTLGVGGLKGYFSAVVDDDGEVRINSGEILPPQSW
jgi:hypothetical protein